MPNILDSLCSSIGRLSVVPNNNVYCFSISIIPLFAQYSMKQESGKFKRLESVNKLYSLFKVKNIKIPL